MLCLFVLSNVFAGKYWGDVANQRKFFESFAAINNFDPLVPDNWYKITGKRIKREVFINILISISYNLKN